MVKGFNNRDFGEDLTKAEVALIDTPKGKVKNKLYGL